MKQPSLVRPKAFSKMVGQSKVTHLIRKMVRKSVPKAWLFYGGTGLGKTSIAEIVALSLQCTHMEKFGEPCRKCWKNYSNFPIYMLNASDKTGAPELREFVSGSEYTNIIGAGTRKVFILDEAHQISKAGQNLLLKYLEDDSNNAVFIICSTEPRKLISTLRRRLVKFKMQPLDTDQITDYVTQLLEGYDLAVDAMVSALCEQGIDSPGIIAQAVFVYISGATAEEAAKSEESLEVDSKALCKAVTKGDWPQVCALLHNTPNGDARGLRASIVGYLRVILLETESFDKRNKILADCIKRLCYMHFPDDLIVMSALAAELYTVTELFSEYSR